MLRRVSTNYVLVSIAIDFGLTLFALVLAFQLRLVLPDLPGLIQVGVLMHLQFPHYLFYIVPGLWVAVFFASSVYDLKRTHNVIDEILRVSLAIGLSTLVFSGLLYLFVRDFSRYLLLTFVIFNLVLILGWRLLFRFVRRVQRQATREHRVLLVGAGEVGQRVGSMIQENSWSGLHCVGLLDDDPKKSIDGIINLGDLASLRRIVLHYKINDVVIALPQRAYGKVNRIVVELHDLPVHVRVVPDYFSLALYRASVDDFGGLPMINLRDPALNDVQRLMKRSFDLIIGGATFLLFLPIFGVVALIIRLDSPGPILFNQKRIGENGKEFTMFKYRSMIKGAEKIQQQFNIVTDDGTLLFKSADDPRITKFGKFMRRTSLDEIPQLINVLKGDMSLVGPRPELPWLVEKYKPWQRKRFAVPQGITGWWQINGRSDKPMHLHTEDDLYYVQNYSLWLDLYILLRTFLVVLQGKGAF